MRRGRDEQLPNTEDGEPAETSETASAGTETAKTETAKIESAEAAKTGSAEAETETAATAGAKTGSATAKPAATRGATTASPLADGVQRRALLGAGALVVVALAVVVGVLLTQRTTGWPLHPQLKTTALEQARTEAVQAASDSAVALLSYDHTTVDDELRNAAERTTGSFRDDYTKVTTATVVPAAKQKAVTTRATVVGAAASTASPDKVDALVYLNQSTTTQDAPDPSMSGSRLVLTMEKVDGRWLVAAMTPV
ncbi:hypothetical protein [Rhodococcus sp. X156]|uniref:hypothetical protein n=1 Tax=Rhodococcus sp. X156 TaxID=2499145 RepID=UPI001F495E14|nr:hypothetical protein [Rhodococcus sp. X156]